MKIRVAVVMIALALMLPSLSAQEGALTHARAVVNVTQNQPYFVTLKWASAFADDKYTVSCSPVVTSGFQAAGSGVYLLQVTTVAPTYVKVELAAIGTGPIGIDCIAIHD